MQGRTLDAARWAARGWVVAGLVVGVLGAAAGTASAAPAAPSAPPAPVISEVMGQLTVPAGQVYRGDVNLVGGNVTVDGTLEGGVTMTAGRVAVGPAGRIVGLVQLGAGLVQVAPGGRIAGPVQVGAESLPDLLCPASAAGGCSVTGAGGPRFPTQAATALRLPAREVRLVGCPVRAGGLPVCLGPSRLLRWLGIGPALGWVVVGMRLLAWLGLLALALPVAAIWPRQVASVRRQIETDPGRSALVGLVAAVLAIPVLAIVAITIIGIPVAFAAALGLVAAWFLGYVAVIGLVGSRTGALARGGEVPAILWAMVLGSVLLAAVHWIPVLGGLVSFAVACVGLGAVLLSRFGTDRPWLPPRRDGGGVPAPRPLVGDSGPKEPEA